MKAVLCRQVLQRVRRLDVGDRKLSEPALMYGLAYLGHKSEIVGNIMQGIEIQPEDFSGHKQVPQIRPRMVLAGITSTGRVKRSFIRTIARIFDHYTPF